MTTFSRRSFLRTAALASAGAAVPVAAAQGADFSFIVINDLHYRDERCGRWLERVVKRIRESKPAPSMVVLAGDLSEDGTAAQLGAVREIFQMLPGPVVSLIGNHDYTLAGDRSAYEKLYGARLNRHFDFGGYQFLALDSTEGRKVYRTRIPDSTLHWVDGQKPSLSSNRPLIVLTHFPLGRNWLRPKNASAVLDRLQLFPLQAAFSGHWHGLTERTVHGAHLSTGRCCSWWRTNHDGSPLKGYTLAHARDGVITHEFVAVAVPSLA